MAQLNTAQTTDFIPHATIASSQTILISGINIYIQISKIFEILCISLYIYIYSCISMHVNVQVESAQTILAGLPLISAT